MSHDTHEAHAHGHSHEENPSIPFKAAFLFVLIIVGLFVAAMGFVKSMSHDESGHGGAHTEATHDAHGAAATHEAAHDASAHEEHTAPATEGGAHQEAEHSKEAAAEHH
jgi:hypothetical protein